MSLPDIRITGGEQVIRTLTECASDFVQTDYRYPLTIVMDSFADFVRDKVKAGAREQQLKGYFDWVETLARRGEPATDNLVSVCFLEGMPWGKLGVKHLMGSATLALARQDPGNMDPAIL